MDDSSQPELIRFTRIRVKDVAAFLAIHEMALAAQGKLGLTEEVFQSSADPNELTIQIRGSAEAHRQWLESPERVELASRLELDGPPVSWETTRLV